VWNNLNVQDGGNAFIGTAAVLIEVTLSGFACHILRKGQSTTDPEQIRIVRETSNWHWAVVQSI
jgi:hypothetical protein